jgi:hypothetical protein
MLKNPFQIHHSARQRQASSLLLLRKKPQQLLMEKKRKKKMMLMMMLYEGAIALPQPQNLEDPPTLRPDAIFHFLQKCTRDFVSPHDCVLSLSLSLSLPLCGTVNMSSSPNLLPLLGFV